MRRKSDGTKSAGGDVHASLLDFGPVRGGTEVSVKNPSTYVVDTMFRIQHPGTGRSMALLVCSATGGSNGWLVDAATVAARRGATIPCLSPGRCGSHELISLEEALRHGALTSRGDGIHVNVGMLVAVLVEKPPPRKVLT